MTRRIAFFHQNEPLLMQGGIERYLSTIVDEDPTAVIVTEPSTVVHQRIHSCAWGMGPKWFTYSLGIISRIGSVRKELRTNGVAVAELSRPEYVIFSWLLGVPTVFAMHGTGPKHATLSRVIHDICCLMLVWGGARVHVVGRDPSAMPSALFGMLQPRRVFYSDAWFPSSFYPSPYPSTPPIKVFYAGRLAPQKNLPVLFDALLALAASGKFELHYFGSDFDVFPADIRTFVIDHGLQTQDTMQHSISSCHIGILCSNYGEGSPYIIAETLGCGRLFVCTPLPTLVATYGTHPGVTISKSFDSDSFVQAVHISADSLNKATPESIYESSMEYEQSISVSRLIRTIIGGHYE